MPELRPIRILIAEDDDDHAFLLRRAFKQGKVKNEIDLVADGALALRFLKERVGTTDLPGLVVLDVNMPVMDGFEALEAIKLDQDLKHLPVVMLTSSTRDEDIAKAYATGACSYISKPVKFDEFREVIESFNVYWTMVAEIPKPNS